MPEAVEHLVGYLFEVGPMVGEHSVPFSEINAWRESTGAVLSEYEAVALRTLSQHYAGMLREAADAKCPAPYLRREGLPTRAAVAKGLGDLLRSFNTPEVKARIAKRHEARTSKAATQ